MGATFYGGDATWLGHAPFKLGEPAAQSLEPRGAGLRVPVFRYVLVHG